MGLPWLPNLEVVQDSKEARDVLETRLKDASFDASASPQSAALLAIYAISAKKWDDARRLVYQGCLKSPGTGVCLKLGYIL